MIAPALLHGLLHGLTACLALAAAVIAHEWWTRRSPR